MPAPMRSAFVARELFAVAASLWLRYMNRKATAWPSVKGEIIASSLEEDPYDAGSTVNITYRFVVAGRSFCSSQITHAGMPNSLSAKQRLVATYPVGSKGYRLLRSEKPSLGSH